MTRLESIAKAIYERRNGHGCKAWAHLPKSHQEPYLDDARAAVEAMREPTGDMLEAANKAMMHKLVIGPSRFATFASGFSAAIDAILTEEKQ